eukprot:7301317-Pyramimonas_sp.AAC.1
MARPYTEHAYSSLLPKECRFQYARIFSHVDKTSYAEAPGWWELTRLLHEQLKYLKRLMMPLPQARPLGPPCRA